MTNTQSNKKVIESKRPVMNLRLILYVPFYFNKNRSTHSPMQKFPWVSAVTVNRAESRPPSTSQSDRTRPDRNEEHTDFFYHAGDAHVFFCRTTNGLHPALEPPQVWFTFFWCPYGAFVAGDNVKLDPLPALPTATKAAYCHRFGSWSRVLRRR